MEMLNKIELKGLVGNSTTSRVGDRTCTRFSVRTDDCYNDKSGAMYIDTTWFNCTAWDAPDAERLTRGTPVHVVGRIRQVRYMCADGVGQTAMEVVVRDVTIIGEDGR